MKFYWEREGRGMRVFHCFASESDTWEESGVSLCRKWLLDNRAFADHWRKGQPKCRKCQRRQGGL